MLWNRNNHPAGIDVSDNNGVFDWNAWKDHIDFAFMKATEGPSNKFPHGYYDAEFERNWHGTGAAEGINVFRFAYHYAQPDMDPVRQAYQFFDTVRAQGFQESDNAALDLEITNGYSPGHVSFWAYIWCKTVSDLMSDHLGRYKEPLVYTYPSFADAGNCAKLGMFPLWIANYDTPLPHIPPPWPDWAFWQWAANSLGRDVFNGNLKDLERFCNR